MEEYAVMWQSGFFDFEGRLSSLSRASDPLLGLLQSVDFEMFPNPGKTALQNCARKTVPHAGP